jgi:hypothetical protein
MKITLIKKDFALYPATDEDAEMMLRLKRGDAYSCEVRMIRNYRFLRKYMALINLTWEYLTDTEQEKFRSPENMRKQIEIAAGHCQTVWSIKRQEFIEEALSISFAAVDEAEFSRIYDSVKEVIFRMVLRGKITEEDFLNELINF